ncbi:hypothetical protein KASHIRA_01530 [Serratia phage vB_SmaM-Kashira]|nr:hypothetical protein [Acinetobacter phage ABPH49]URC22727.1 hypothetical protein KASHIRA_01530 [Serratia phage vB_SmaM-Kashira]
MSQVLLAVVPHRRLMELKNSGVVRPQTIKDLADIAFIRLRDKIIAKRIEAEKPTGILRLMKRSTFEHHLTREVEVMFENREALVSHVQCIKDRLPTPLVPVDESEVKDLLFLDRATTCAAEAEKVVMLFKLHDEVIVDADTSFLLSWLMSNTQRIKDHIAGEVKDESNQ